MTDETKAEEAENTAPEDAQEELSEARIIALRSADIETKEAKDSEHVKVFILPPGPKPTEANGYSHEANYAATRQYAISQGMRPTGDVRLVSTKKHDNGVSWVLTYAVPVSIVEREHSSEPGIVLEQSDGGADVNTEGAGDSDDTSGQNPA